MGSRDKKKRKAPAADGTLPAADIVARADDSPASGGLMREGVAVAALAATVYAWGACPTIYVGDSGELVAAVHTLGIPHPSGYPLYVMLGKLWTLLLPLGSIAWRMSLFSAACAALTCGGLHALLRRHGLGRLEAGFAATLLAFAPSFWHEANIQRVYTLNAVFVVAAAAFVFAWHRGRRDRDLVLACAVCGLGATNHTFMGMVGVALAIYAPLTAPALWRRPRLVLACAGATFAGLLPYLYLPLRSRMDPRLDWGDPETLDGFIGVLSRRGFWERRYYEGPGDLVTIGGDYLASLGAELLWAGAALALLGIAQARRLGWPVGWLLAVMAVNFAAMASHGSRTDLFVWHRYYIPSYVVAAAFAGAGLQAMATRRAWLPRAALLLPAVSLLLGFAANDRSRYRIAEDFSRKLLDSLPPGAHLSANDDNILFVLIYLQLVEGVRPDVDLILAGVGGSELPPLRFKPGDEELFFSHHPNWEGPLQVLPIGLVFQAVPRGAPLPTLRLPAGRLEGEDDPGIPKDYLTQNLIGHFHYMLGVTFETRDWPRARRSLDAATAAAPHNDVLHYNMGLILRRNGLLQEALAAFERSQAANPRHVASAGRVLARDRVVELRGEVEALVALKRQILGPGEGWPPLDSAAYHERLAAELEQRGAGLPAQGHRLLALERRAASGS